MKKLDKVPICNLAEERSVLIVNYGIQISGKNNLVIVPCNVWTKVSTYNVIMRWLISRYDRILYMIYSLSMLIGIIKWSNMKRRDIVRSIVVNCQFDSLQLCAQAWHVRLKQTKFLNLTVKKYVTLKKLLTSLLRRKHRVYK